VFDPGKAELSGAAAGHLAGFARVANQANPSAPLIPITVEGTASAPAAGAGATAQTKLAKDRADAVVAALHKAGIRQPVRARRARRPAPRTTPRSRSTPTSRPRTRRTATR
jgi:hypothetical protein